MTTTATPRRRDRAPLSSVDSNVGGSLKKNPIRSPLGKQQKRFSTKTAKTPGTTTKRKKRRQKREKNFTIDTPQIESPLFKPVQPAEATVSDNVVVLSATTGVLSTTQLSEQISKFTFGHSGVLYDSQQWEAEQSAAFKSWLNHLFHPEPQIKYAFSEEQRSVELNAAMALFSSRRMLAIRFAIEREVTEGRLAITPMAERNILDWVYVQEQLSTLLLSYTPRWLQLGLEIVLAHYGDQRSQKQHYDMSKESLKKIILEQVLSKPSAVQKYKAVKVKTTSAHFEQMLRVEIQQHALSILLILVFFLDYAKTRQLLTDDPILFNKISQVKSSREILISLCQDCFAKQRSILNHLEYEGISVSHVQEPLDEYDFRVRNFAVDLKDGVCLAKMIDTVTNGSNILSSLRLPADSRKHKMYNVRLALAALRQLGVPNISDITPAHIVDAHQPRIIQLVWSTILYFELPEFRQEIIQYKASRLIQGQVRRFLAMKSYHISLRGCVSLQSLFRGVRLRKRVNEMNAAAREFQKIWRGYDAKVRYGFDLLGIITVQSVVRRFLACKRVTLLSKRIKASIQIQKIWRGYDQKIQYGFVLLDIITVQSVCRQFLDIKRANARRSGVVIIQSVARRWLAKRMVARRQNAIVTIQSFLRKSVAITLKRRELVEVEIENDSHSHPLRHSEIEIDSHSYPQSDSDDDEEGEVIFYSTKQSRRRDNKVSLIRCVEPDTGCSIREEIAESSSLEEDAVSISTCSSFMSEDLEFASEMERDLASMVIQIHWRRYISSARYAMTRKAVITCQSMCRKWIAQKKTHNLRLAKSREELASVKVTAFFRGYYVRIKYMKTLAAATMIQKIVRGHKARKIVEEMKCFEIFLTWEKSAKKIQAQFRRHVCETLYSTVLTGVVQLQTQVRSYHARKTVNHLINARAQAACQIQKTYRSFYASSTFLTQKRKARIIQSVYRRHVFELKCRSAERAAVLIQAAFRSKQTRDLYLLHLKCVHILQRAVRKFLADAKTKVVAATSIQRIWRGYSENVDFMLLVLATIKIQAVTRMRSAVASYHKTLDGIILIQACFRSKLARISITSQQCASIVLQKVGRGLLARKHKKDQLAAIALIQRAAREKIARSLEKVQSCIIIQKVGRRFLARKHKKDQLAAVVTIQRAAREMMARSLKEIRNFAACEIQRVWRGFSAHVDYMMQVMAAMKIQARYRERRARRALLTLSSQRRSSTIIQKAVRGFLARMRKKDQLAAVVTIQRAAREMMARSLKEIRNFAACEIQRVWRGFSAHVDYMMQVMAAMKIQARYRERRARRALLTLSSQRKSSTIIQKAVRGFLARMRKKDQLAAVVTIQRAAREMMARSLKEIRNFAACEIQRVWRGFSAHVDYMMQVMAAMKIQARYRERRARRALLTLSSQRKSSTIIQKAVRGFLARFRKKDQLAAVVTIQRAAREMMARSLKEIRNFAACEIQRVWRGFSAHVDYMMQVMAAMKIQARYRERRARRARLVLSSQRRSSTIIQKAVRGFLARVQKERALSAVAVIQRAAREMIVRSQDDLLRNFAACEIQRVWRGFSAHVDYMLKVMAVIRIQSSVRCFLRKKRLHLTVAMDKVVQKVDLAKTVDVNETSLSSPNFATSPKPLSESPEMAIDSFPRVVDAFAYESNRKQEVNNALAIPRFITTTSRMATLNKINVRSLSKYEKHTAKAIKVLRKSALFPEVMGAVSTLEKTTSKSIDSCKLLLRARGQDNLLSLLASCNRSSPHLELVRVILHIFANVSRHQACLSVLVGRQSLSVLTDVVQMFRDKSDIFELSTSLLETFVRSDAFIISKYSSLEQRRCLGGVLSLSRKRASIRSSSELDKGIVYLENVIRILKVAQ